MSLHARQQSRSAAYRRRGWPPVRTALRRVEQLELWLRPRLARVERLPGYWAPLFLLGLAGILRVAAVLAWHVDPIWDGNFYHTGAISLADGEGYTTLEGGSPRSHYPVGYSALLAPAYWLFGSGPLVAPLFNAAVGVASTWLVWRFGRRALGSRRGFIAALLMAVHPGLILYCNLTMTEPLAGFLLLAAGYAVLRLPSGTSGPWLSGALLGLAVLVRPQSLLALPLLLWASPGSWSRRIGITLRAGLVCALMVAPWTVRNCRVLDGCALVSTNGGWNLAISALTEDGGYRELPPGSACRDAQGPVEQDRCFREQGWAHIARDPLAWLAKIPDKLRHTYNYEAFAIGYLAHADPETWPQQRAWAWIRWVGGFHHLLMFVAVLSVLARPHGALLRAPRTPESAPSPPWPQQALLLASLAWVLLSLLVEDKPVFWLAVAAPAVALIPVPGAPSPLPRYWWGLLLLTSLTHAVFFGSDRYHLVVSPLLCLLAAAALRKTAPAQSPA